MRPHVVTFALSVALLLTLAVVHALGWREATSVVAGNAVDPATALRGVVYVLAWLVAVCVAPVLGLGAALAWAWDRRG